MSGVGDNVKAITIAFKIEGWIWIHAAEWLRDDEEDELLLEVRHWLVGVQ